MSSSGIDDCFYIKIKTRKHSSSNAQLEWVEYKWYDITENK